MALVSLVLGLTISIQQVLSDTLVCPRPAGWCTGPGESYFKQDAGKYLIATCLYDNTKRFGQIVKINDKCVDVSPKLIYPQTEADIVTDCPPPNNFCIDDDSYLDFQVCGNRILMTCWSKVGKFGQLIMANGKCINTWPNGWDNNCVGNILMDCVPPQNWCPVDEGTLILRPCKSLDFYLPTCVGKNSNKYYGELVGEDKKDKRKCKSTWPNGISTCDTDLDVKCRRPNNWCNGLNEIFSYEIKQGCKDKIPTCNTKGKLSQIINVNGKCIASGPDALQQCYGQIKSQCQRPIGWCSDNNDVFQYLKCGDKGYVPTCFNRVNKAVFGQIIRLKGKCVDTWPKGNDACLESSAKVSLVNYKDSNNEHKRVYVSNNNNNSFELEYVNIMIFVVGISITLFMLSGACYFIKYTWLNIPQTSTKQSYSKIAVSDLNTNV